MTKDMLTDYRKLKWSAVRRGKVAVLGDGRFKVLSKKVRRYIAGISDPLMREIMRKYYVECRTLSSIAAELGCSINTVFYWKKRCEKGLK